MVFSSVSVVANALRLRRFKAQRSIAAAWVHSDPARCSPTSTPDKDSSMPFEHHDVIVIGGGQAGLAVGHHLARQDRRFTILDAAPAPAAAWRTRWDSLRLFTPARYDNLPGLAFPGDPDHYPTRDEVVSYLTDYARHFRRGPR